MKSPSNGLLVALAVISTILGCGSRESHRQQQTQRLLSRFEVETRLMLIRTRKLPLTLDELLAGLNSESADFRDSDREVSHPGISDGLDSWGNKLVYETHYDRMIVLRSMGPNELDDKGEQDDIEIAIDVSEYLQP
jgi:hypothetical protein